MNARTAAARTLAQVLGDNKSLSAVLPDVLKRVTPDDRALAQELCYGVLRFLPRLEFLAAGLLNRPLKKKDRDVHALILAGLYQLLYLNVPAHAAVAETVAAARALRKEWAAGLVNAVLRGFQRDAATLVTHADADPVARTAHPPWLLSTLQHEWPDHWQDIVTADNQRPPMTLRVNALHLTRDACQKRLHATGINAQPVAHAPCALTLDTPVDVERLPGFADGDVSVQDAAAQLAAPLLELAPGQRVLDACAAPGGKTGHILESAPDVQLVAVDHDPERLERVADTLQRLRVQAELRAGDAADPHDWWDGKPFDRILLDAPCSGSGVIRRHPDIKHLRNAADIEPLAARQYRLLEALWPLLAPGGMLLYATCSVLPRENRANLAQFLAAHADARGQPIVAGWGHAQAPGRQLLPGEDGMDGFYYARLNKP